MRSNSPFELFLSLILIIGAAPLLMGTLDITKKKNKIQIQHTSIIEVELEPNNAKFDDILSVALFNDVWYSPVTDIPPKDEKIKVLPKKNISKKQAELLLYAHNIAKKDGHSNPSILQGIIWQESKAGGYPGYEVAGDEFGLKIGKRYYGVGQIKVAAARDVFRYFPKDFPNFHWKKTDDEIIIAYLIADPKFNIRVASKYLWIVSHNKYRNKRPTNFGITAYNQGVGGALNLNYDRWHYTVAVNKYAGTFLKTFNNLNKTHLE